VLVVAFVVAAILACLALILAPSIDAWLRKRDFDKRMGRLKKR